MLNLGGEHLTVLSENDTAVAGLGSVSGSDVRRVVFVIVDIGNGIDAAAVVIIFIVAATTHIASIIRPIVAITSFKTTVTAVIRGALSVTIAVTVAALFEFAVGFSPLGAIAFAFRLFENTTTVAFVEDTACAITAVNTWASR